MSNIVPWAPLIFVTLTMIGCSSEDPETTKVGSSNQTQLSDKKSVDRHAVTLNGMTVSLTGNPNRVEVVGYLRERGMQQGFKKTDNGMAAIMVVHGIMTTGTKGETALSQCIATSGLMALDKLSNSLGGQDVRSQLKKNSIEAQPTYAKE